MKTCCILFFSFCVTALCHAEPSRFFDDFMGKSPPVSSLAEMKKADFAAFLKERSLDASIPMASGDKLSMDKVMLVSPAGIKIISDKGIEVLPWDLVQPEFRHYMGWSTEVQSRYQSQKDVDNRVGNIHAAAERMKAIQAQNSASASAPASSARPKAPKGEVPGPVTAARIRSRALEKWGSNFSMVEYEIKNETEACRQLDQWLEYGMPGLPWAVSARILVDANKKWEGNFSMCIYEAKNQADAWRRLNGL